MKRASCFPLRMVSLGRYNTVFFHEGIQFQASLCTGVLTLFVIAGFITATLVILIGVLQRDHYNLDVSTKALTAYNSTAGGSPTNTTLKCNGCIDVTMVDFFSMISNNQTGLIVYNSDYTQEMADCKSLSAKMEILALNGTR